MKRTPPRQDLYPPLKRLGQHFMVNPQVIDRILAACQLTPKDTVLEIGPGKGILTARIAPLVKRIIAVEKDRRLYDHLLKTFPAPNLEVIHADILRFRIEDLPAPIKVIGNIPYNISSPIIELLIDARTSIDTVILTVQYEFARRMVAGVHTKDYSAMSCYAQYYCQPDILFNISPSAFRPAPKVMSCCVRMDFSQRRPAMVNEDWLFRIIRTAFQQRRKKIGNALGGLIDAQIILGACRAVKIDPMARAENITLPQFITLAQKTERFRFKRGNDD